MIKEANDKQINQLQNCDKNKKILIDKDWLYQKYFIELWTTEKIAKFIGCSSPTVSCRMKEFGFILRSRSEGRKGCLNPMFGKPGPYKGKHRPDHVVKYFKSKLPRGEQHFRYKKPEDRIEPINGQIRNCQKSKDWKFSVLKRDNFQCQICSSKKTLQVDHIIPFTKIKKEFNVKTLDDAIECELLWDISNGRTLCLKCHKKTDTYGYKKGQKHG